MKAAVIIFSAFCALISFATVSGADGESQQSTEAPVQRVHVLNPGEREYLSPNLIGVQNIAVTNIPVTIDFVNIVDAFREVVDGVKYEIVLNALNTTDNNTEIVCRIVVLEKPWLTTLWGDKVRLLKESNCTSEELLDNTRDRKSIEEKYETNAIFTGNRNELTADDMSKLESQILDSSRKPQLTRQQTVTTTTSTTTESIASDDVTEPVNTQTEAEGSVESDSATTQEAIVLSSTEASTTTTTTTTTEKLPELSADEKKWLDDFLSIGAYNFEISHQTKAESQSNTEQLNDEEPGKTPIAGGVSQLNAEELQREQENLSKSLALLATGDGPSYTIEKVYSGTKQVVAGSLVKLDADLVSGSGEKSRCIVSLWSRPWLPKDGYEVKFECKDKETVVKRHSRAVENRIVGAPTPLNEEELLSEQANLAKSLSILATGDGPSYTIDKVYSGTTQIVAGSLIRLDADLIEGSTGEKSRCLVSIWSQPWLKKDGYELTFDCKDKPKVVQRHSRSVDDIVLGGYREFNEEELQSEQANLAKSLALLATGDGPSYTVDKVYSGSTQFVAGTLVKLDADLIDGKTGEKSRCLVSIWSQPWLKKDGYELTFDCKDKSKLVQRHSRSVENRRVTRQLGGARKLNEQELQSEQANLAKSLSILATGDGPSYTVDKVYSGTSQVVSGSLVKLDADLIDGSTGEKSRCLVSIWSQPWLKKDGYELTFDCKDKSKLVQRHSRSVENRRVTRQLGGARKLNEQELQSEQANLAKSLSIIATGDGPSYTVDKVYSGTSQVVSGSLVKLDADLIDGSTGEKSRCLVSIWSQPWLKKDGYELTFDCKDKPKVVQRHSRSIHEVSSPSKRSLVGVPKELDEDELKIEEAKIKESLTKLAAGDGPFYTISKVFRGTKRIVAGTLVTIDAELIDDISGDKENCTISLWSRLWIPVDGHEVTFECEDKPKSVYRHSRSVEYAQKKSHKKSHRLLNKAEYLFKKFQTKYNKTYHNSMEHQMRMRIFKHNLKLIMDLNKHEMGSAKYGITEFADMTTTEYRERTGLLPREETNSVRTQASIPDVKLPKEFDWREKGVVSAVKNQGNCGSCWAFSVTGNIEGLHAVKTGKLEEYSEQELLDCDTIDSACQGGLPDNAYQAIEKIGGLELESEYPYEGKKGSCHYNSTLARVKVSGAVDLPKNETAMAQWLLVNGPISIGINANAMQFYRGGVSHPWKVLCAKSNLDHGVLIVGYGVSDYPMFKKTLPYWIVKNSWGSKWGEQGYYRVFRGDNTCGVSEMATSAILA